MNDIVINPAAAADAVTATNHNPVAGGDGVDSFATKQQLHRGDHGAPDAGVADTGHHSNSHTSHHEVKDHNKRGSFLTNEVDEESTRSPFKEAWSASKDKLLSGAAMFAGFATLLGLSIAAISAVPFVGTISALLPEAIAPLLPGGIGAALAGAVWMSGNEFTKVYKQERSIENSKLNSFIDKARDTLGHAKERVQETAHDITHPHDKEIREIGELGIVGGSLSSNLGTTAFLVEVPNEMVEAAPANQTVQAILESGPKDTTSALLERNIGSAIERLENTPEMDAQASI